MVFEFGSFQLDVATGELRRDGKPVRLQPQPAKVLALLAGHAGSLVTREQIRAQIWSGGTFVDFEQGLNYCIAQIRTALGDSARSPQYVETLQRRGYRFKASVRDCGAAAEATGKILLAVLPLENLSGDVEQEYFSDGLTEEMITALGRINPQRLGVIARTSAMRYKGRTRTVDAVARELGVGYILEGSVRRGADRVRVTAQLVQASDQSNVWSDAFDRALGDMLALQSELAAAIAQAIRVRLAPAEEKRLASRRPIAPVVYELYLKGRYFWNRRSRESLAASVLCFEQAIEHHTDYAAAYAGLADVYLTQLDYNYLLPRDAFALANRTVLEALRLDDTLADPHTSLGHLRLHEFNWRAAEQEFTRAIALNPSYATAHYYYGNLLAALGRTDEAVAEARRVLELDPMSANARQNLAFLLYLGERYDEALKQCADAVAIDPGSANTDYLIGLINERLGRHDEALAAFHQRWPAASGRGTTIAAAVGFVHARAGRRDEALQVRNRLESLADQEYVSSYDMALLYVALGDADHAVERLWRGHQEYSSFLPYLNVDARFDSLRSHPSFRALIERMRFPPRPERAPAAPVSAAKRVVIAVLPFENLSGDVEQEYFSDDLTEDMIAQLARLNPQRLGVIARTSAMRYKAINKTVSEIGRELGVTYVVEGSVRRSGGRLRVIAQLIEVTGQTPLWSQSYDRDVNDVLALQGELATSIAREVKVTLAPRETLRMAHAAPVGQQAHEAYLKGRYFWNKRTEEAMRKAIEFFQEAIRHEPDYAAAHDGISDCYVMLACRGVLPVKETFQRARAAAQKALEIDGGLGEAHASLAHVRLHDWDWTGLDEDFRRALELGPGHAFAYYWYSEYLMAVGRAEEALAMVDTAHRMDPLSTVLGASQGMIRYLARRYDEAVEHLQQALAIDPHHFLPHFRLGLVYLQQRMTRETIDEMETAVRLSARSTETLTGLAQAYAAAGMTDAMVGVIHELEAQTGVRYVSPYNMSRVYASLGEAELAFLWLERAYDEHNPDLIELRNEPVFDPLRSDARFASLLGRIGWRIEAA
jgi:TolB-like protein/Tfp pilus assembly protein PilF